jgi:oligosaccharyltransferase complex subunit alpha (ribophorin I)
LQIQPRFPLFGGWKTEWYQGYNVPAGGFVTANADGSYTLTYNANIPYADMPIRELVAKVVLPEAATVVSVSSPQPHTTEYSRRFTYLDGPFFGRPVVVLTSRNVVSSGGPTGDITVTYRLPLFALAYKFGYLLVAFFGLFALIAVASRVDVSLRSAGAPVGAEKKRQ